MTSAAARTNVAVALAAYRERVKLNAEAAAGTTDAFTAWWGSVTGLDTAQAGVRTSAAGDATLLAAYEARAGRLVDDLDAAELVRAIGFELSRPDLTKLADQLTAGGAAKVVAKDSAADLAAVAQTVGGGWLAVLKASPYLVAAFLALVAWSWLGKRRA